jgi:hypothetical protein
MALRKREDTVLEFKRGSTRSHSGELALEEEVTLEEAIDLSQDRLRNE